MLKNKEHQLFQNECGLKLVLRSSFLNLPQQAFPSWLGPSLLQPELDHYHSSSRNPKKKKKERTERASINLIVSTQPQSRHHLLLLLILHLIHHTRYLPLRSVPSEASPSGKPRHDRGFFVLVRDGGERRVEEGGRRELEVGGRGKGGVLIE